MPLYLYDFKCDHCGIVEEVSFDTFEQYQKAKINQGDLMNFGCSKGCCVPMRRVYCGFTIIGGDWNWKKGYRTGIDDPVKEVKYDMMRLEQSATATGNLKEFRKKQKALKLFAEANSEILQ